MKIGYIGLGAMGGSLARRLLKSHPVQVWDLDPAAVNRLVQSGATPAASPAALANSCNLVFTCLPRSANVRELLFGTGALASALSPGTIVIDQTSGDPADTARMALDIAARDSFLLDAPVSGGQRGAEAGTIAIMLAGPQAAYEKARPVLQSISPNVEYCGPRGGDAHALKLINNTKSASVRLATLELVALGRKLGVPLADMTRALNAGEGSSKASTIGLAALLEGRPPVGEFALALLVKDVTLGTGLATATRTPLLLANLVRAHHEAALIALGPQAQLAQIFDLISGAAGTTFADSAAQSGVRSQQEAGELAALLARAVATSNLLITCECAALAKRFGLPLDLLARVLLAGGAWNAAAARLLPLLAAEEHATGPGLREVLADLNTVAGLARSCGVPIPLSDTVRGMVEAASHQPGADNSLLALPRWIGSLAGVEFAKH
ncbi:NAD(P)-dependent oxidoreductase [Hydrogenophaga sp.]|uniref:NAD(P)-dependent oxidoreductase n=1 Tax=Hydrogenophaga sp. TaxID=1904254 RepID=UPI00271B9208|nr:NAD(P)-dependent oxidoreductase [Hydrogenophaga sp.]MDO9437059.1 NAD(P)-dependent oxidoreductase [Hydrogenophaga sp.]